MASGQAGGHEVNNNFNLIRLLAALAVIWSHSYPLARGSGNHDDLHWYFGYEVGRVAVDVFFVVSGYLITKSAARSDSWSTFFVNRVLRIYPGLWACLILTCSIYVFVNINNRDVDLLNEVAQYIGTNALLIRGAIDFSMDGAFAGNPYGGVINGSLWTLPWELRMYALVAIIYFIAYPLRRYLIVSVLLLVFVTQVLCHYQVLQAHPLVPLVSRFACTFFMGAFVAEFFPSSRPPLSFSASLLAFLVLLGFFGVALPYVVYLAVLPMAVFGIALSFSSPEFVRRIVSTDVSYGVYLYGFPIQQFVAALVPGISPTAMTLISAPAALVMGWISYKFVEAPALAYKPRLLAGISRLTMLGGRT
jgi:peptidoglycan/LPS O-acetylase OafA/YrhL